MATSAQAARYLPASRADAVDADFALRLMRVAIKWYAVPGERRVAPDDARRGRDRARPDSEQRAAMTMQVNRFTLLHAARPATPLGQAEADFSCAGARRQTPPWGRQQNQSGSGKGSSRSRKAVAGAAAARAQTGPRGDGGKKG
jgi:hypothetical protein